MICSKSDCRTPPSSSSFILACPSLSVQVTTLFLSPRRVSFLSLQVGGLLCPSFSFWGFKALPLVPPSFLSASFILQNMMQWPSENLTLFLITSHLCWCNIHFSGFDLTKAMLPSSFRKATAAETTSLARNPETSLLLSWLSFLYLILLFGWVFILKK